MTNETKDCVNRMLMCACNIGCLPIVEDLVNIFGADVNYKIESKRTPLHIAAYAGHLNIVDFLVFKRADITAVDHVNDTPLDDAINNGHHNIVAYLKGAGDSVNKKRVELMINLDEGIKRDSAIGFSSDLMDILNKHFSTFQGAVELTFKGDKSE